MDNQFLPPLPVPPEERVSYGKKCLLLGLQCLLLMFGTLIVYMLVYSREGLNDKVGAEISGDWGGPIYFDGLVATGDSLHSGSVYPVSSVCDVAFVTQTLHRGIYEIEVYDAEVKISGIFEKESLGNDSSGKILISLSLPENRIGRLDPVKICGKEYTWKTDGKTLSIEPDLEGLPENIDFETSFSTRGSGGFFVYQRGRKYETNFEGAASNPSFQGGALPEKRSVSADSFTASWHGRRGLGAYVGADFLTGVDRYQKVARSLKYSFIIIFLTYIAVLTVEIIRKRRIPLLNYFLIGVALIVFYTLLLSFAEMVAFWLAYLIAALMTVALISLYLGMILKSRNTGLIVGCVLALYYGACFVMLSSTYALLLGSLLLFAAVGLLMYATLRIQR